MNIKIGDIVVDRIGDAWIVSHDINGEQKTFVVTDFLTHSFETMINIEDVVAQEETPQNVSWLFIARNNKKLKRAIGE